MQVNNSLIITEECSKFYDETLDVWGLPQKFKGVEFYPIKLIDKKMLKYLHMLFAHCKNQIPDKDIIKMSYLKFLVYVLANSQNEVDVNSMLYEFMRYITKHEVEVLVYYRSDKLESANDIYLTFKVKQVNINNEIVDVVFTESEFEIIREIILLQNGLNLAYIDDYNQELEEKLNFINRNAQNLTFKEQIFSFCSLMKCPITMFKDYTWYQFMQHLERSEIVFDYEVFKPLESSGQIEFKNSRLKHWLEHIPQKGRYDSILVRKDTYVKDNDLFKISNEK